MASTLPGSAATRVLLFISGALSLVLADKSFRHFGDAYAVLLLSLWSAQRVSASSSSASRKSHCLKVKTRVGTHLISSRRRTQAATHPQGNARNGAAAASPSTDSRQPIVRDSTVKETELGSFAMANRFTGDPPTRAEPAPPSATRTSGQAAPRWTES